MPIIELKEMIALVNQKINALHRLENEIDIQMAKAEKNKQLFLTRAFIADL